MKVGCRLIEGDFPATAEASQEFSNHNDNPVYGELENRYQLDL